MTGKFDTEKLIRYIVENATPFQQCFFKSLFSTRMEPGTLEELAKYRTAEGGWIGLDPDYQGPASSVTCAMSAFSKFERLKISRDKLLEGSIAYLRKIQKADGSWDEPTEILDYNPPRWYLPRIKENKIWFTNGMARYLYSRAPGETDMLEKARGYLRKFWDGHTFPGYEHNNWMGIVTFAGTGEPGDEDIQRGCLDNLETKIETYDFADVVWALESLYQLKFDANRPIVKKCIRRLETGQLEDGGMQTEYEEHQRVDVGIEVLDSLANYSLIPRHIDFEKYGKQN